MTLRFSTRKAAENYLTRNGFEYIGKGDWIDSNKRVVFICGNGKQTTIESD